MFSLSQCLGNEDEYKAYFNENIEGLDQIEGIWSCDRTVKIFGPANKTDYYPQAEKCVIVRDSEGFKVCNISGSSDYSECRLNLTANSNLYLLTKTLENTGSIVKANVHMINDGVLEYKFLIPEKDIKYKDFSIAIVIKMYKLYPTNDLINSNKDKQDFTPSSGTAFAISRDGLIASNYHVIEGASKIYVKGVNGDFGNPKEAKILLEDKKNDIVILKIENEMNLGDIPYTIVGQGQDVGTSIFCLGFPLRASMGDEVKLTNGIISSKTGFDGDITTYQISAPVQPGNSGGPLFDDKGELIGIVSSKHTDAENVSYAIKVSYLKNLIDVLDNPPILPDLNKMNGKILSEQVKLAKNFIYIIETN
jgi:S1-C subfamily serine protease